MKEEDRQKFDRSLEQANARINARLDEQPKIRAPAWWPGDAAASADNLEAARSMGYAIGAVT